MPMCQRFLWPLFGARPDERGVEQKLLTKNTENQKFETDRRYQFEGFAFQHILKGCLYIFIIQQGFFRNNGEHKTSTTL